MMKTNWTIAAAALLVGGAGGFLAGRGGGDEQGPAEEASVLATKSGRSGVAPAAADSGTRPTRSSRSLDEIRREPGQMNRLESLMDYITGLDPAQFEAEAAKLENLPWQERMMSAFLLFSRWGEVDPMAALEYSNKMGFAGMFTKPAILQSWASVDPENAAKHYQENPRDFMMMGMGRGPGGGQSGASVIAAEWARNNPDGALAWAQSLEGRDRSEAISAALREMAAKDPAAAAAKLATLSGDDLGRSYSEIARQWGAKNWDEAQAWAKTLPAEEQGRALSAAIEGLARQDVRKAAQQVSAMPADQVDDNAVEAVAQQMARDNPAEAAKWLSGLKVEDTGGAMREVMVNWTATDSAAALQFVQQQPAGELRDEAAATYVWTNRSGDPQQSMTVAETISDEGSRARAVSAAAMRWMADDEAAAKTYIQNSTAINDEVKQRLLSGEGRRGPGDGGGPGGGPPGGGRGGRGR